MAFTINPGKQLGDANYHRVREWFQLHLCGTQRECAKALNLSEAAVNRHVRRIRQEWKQISND